MNALELTGRARTHVVEPPGLQGLMQPAAAAAFLAMCEAAARSGIVLEAVSAFRHFDRQRQIWNAEFRRIHHLLTERELISQLPLIALAKETEADVGQEGRGAFDKGFLLGRKNPQFLNRVPEVLHLLQRIRDEAHRFAISYDQQRHRTEHLASVLDTIPGVGPKRRQLLIQTFGSLESIGEASTDDLEKVPGISPRLAQSIHLSLQGLSRVASLPLHQNNSDRS